MTALYPPPLKQLVYASVATPPAGPGRLEELLATSRRRNREAGLTGLLIHHAGAGPSRHCRKAPAVDETFARIRRDPRHAAVEVLLEGSVGGRSFAAWDMACTAVTGSRWLELATAEWEFNRDTLADPRASPGLTLLEQVWAEHAAASPPAPAALEMAGNTGSGAFRPAAE